MGGRGEGGWNERGGRFWEGNFGVGDVEVCLKGFLWMCLQRFR